MKTEKDLTVRQGEKLFKLARSSQGNGQCFSADQVEKISLFLKWKCGDDETAMKLLVGSFQPSLKERIEQELSKSSS